MSWKNQSSIVGQLQLQSANEEEVGDKIHLEEAEEKSVDGNGVDGEAGGGHDVGTDHDQQDRDEAGDDDDKDGGDGDDGGNAWQVSGEASDVKANHDEND